MGNPGGGNSRTTHHALFMQAGDVVLLGTDGLFDNLWDDQLTAQVAAFMGGMRNEVGAGEGGGGT